MSRAPKPRRAPVATAAAELTLEDDRPAAGRAMMIPDASGPMVAADANPAHLLAIAVQRGDGLETIARLMDLQDRWEAKQARRAYVAAMARFKLNAPTIVKDKTVDFQPNNGGRVIYDHASLAEVVGKIVPALAREGISHAWDNRVEGGKIVVSVTLTHEAGHSETVTMPPVAPDDSGKKNPIQQMASAIAYVQRYSLLAITGLAAKDQDDDGRAGGGEWKGITTEQVAELEAEVKRLGADRTGFLRHIRCETFEDIAAANFDAVMATLRAKKSRAGGKGGTTPPRSKSAQRQAPEDRMGKCARLQAAIDRTGVPEGEVFERYKAGDVGDMTDAEIEDAIEWLGRII